MVVRLNYARSVHCRVSVFVSHVTFAVQLSVGGGQSGVLSIRLVKVG